MSCSQCEYSATYGRHANLNDYKICIKSNRYVALTFNLIRDKENGRYMYVIKIILGELRIL